VYDIWSAGTRAALCANRGTAFARRITAALPPHCRRAPAQKAASRGIPLAAALQISRRTLERE